MINTVKLSIKAPTQIDDQKVIDQLPKGIRRSLGKRDGHSGFNLETGVRDVGFGKGMITYKVGETAVNVFIDN